jgi:hypothetical protein
MQITIDLGSETVEAELPEVPISFPVAPGGTLYGFLQNFYPENLLKKGHLYDAQECREIRARHAEDWPAWVRHGYTWNMFCREVNHLPQSEALDLTRLLLSRDLTAEMALGGLLGSRRRDAFEKATGLSPERFIVTWLRIANRYAWAERAASQGVPDTLYDPIPPICYSGRETVERVFKKHIEPYLREAFHVKGFTNTLEAFAQAVLYAFGYLPGKPVHVPDEIWERAVAGLFGQHHPLALMCAYPGDYFNHVAQEEQSGRGAFFPTPIEVAQVMGEMLTGNGHEQDTAEARRARLLQEVCDPAVGTGNLAWPLMNDFIRGRFLDINPSMVHATRALFALYAPWFAGRVFCVNSLEANTEKIIREQAHQYAVDAALAYAGFKSYTERKARAVLSEQQGERLLDQTRELERTVSHIQARASARSLKRNHAYGRSLINLLQQLDGPMGEKEKPATRPNGRLEKPTTHRRRPKPAHPAQLSLFD